jgi:hypothetical protein
MSRYVTGLTSRFSPWIGALYLALMVTQVFAAEPELLARPDAFRTLVNPDCSHCIDEAKARAGELRGDDPVLAWTRGKYAGGAIPIRFFLNPYRVISDTYGVFVFDPDAGFARGYEPSLDFTFYGWRNGILVMRHKDGTLFSTLSGVAFDGPRKGERLKPIATVTTNWGYWNKAYPGSVAYRMFEKYQPIEVPDKDNPDSKSTRGPADSRLPAVAEVLGVTVGATHKSYPLESLPKEGGIIRDQLAGQDIVILWQPSTRTAAAYAPRLDEPDSNHAIKLEFDATEPLTPFVDRETDSRFGVEGRAVSGELKGKALTWIDSVQCRWFAWSAEYPDTSIAKPTRSAELKPGGAKQAALTDKPTEIVLVDPDSVTPKSLDAWRAEGFTAVAALLDEDHPADAYRSAASAAHSAGVDLYYWIEVARNTKLADAHPRWMASLGMHNDWQKRFSAVSPPKKGEVAKAYPWVPIGYAEAFQAHLQRIKALLEKVPAQYSGLLLNDLQGGPAACGCGNLQCRWAIDYGVPATATPLSVDDAAARFVAKVRELAPGKQIVPIWMTECEELDLPADKARGGRTTGLCGSVACAHGTCPKAFRKQWTALVNSHQGPIGLLATQEACGRDTDFYGSPTGWIPATVNYLDRTPVSDDGQSLPHNRLWLVVQAAAKGNAGELAARTEARQLCPHAIVAARVKLDQSYEPRIINAAQAE